MNGEEVNKVIDNLCDKLGTTANTLIPEMAGYQIAEHAIWLVISLIFIGMAITMVVKIIRMKKADENMLVLYPDKLRQIDEELRKTEHWNNLNMWQRNEWLTLVSYADRITGTACYDVDNYYYLGFGAVLTGSFGLITFGVALTKILGWYLAPTASMFMWVINAIGGN